jgi:hypothetical protein
MANPNPKKPDETYLFKSQWRTGKTVQRRLPSAIETPVFAIAHCIDRNPSIANQYLAIAHCIDRKPEIAVQLLAFAQSLLAE